MEQEGTRFPHATQKGTQFKIWIVHFWNFPSNIFRSSWPPVTEILGNKTIYKKGLLLLHTVSFVFCASLYHQCLAERLAYRRKKNKSMQWNNIQSLNENYRTDYTFQWIYVINIANGPSNTHSPLLFTHCWYVAGQTLYFEPSLSYKCGNATNFSSELRLFGKWVRFDHTIFFLFCH